MTTRGPTAADPIEAVLSRIEAHWNDIRGERVMPSRGDIDPAVLGSVLPHVILLDVLREPLDFRYRLLGEHMVTHGGVHEPGDLLSDVVARNARVQPAFDAYKAAATTLRAARCVFTYETRKGTERTVTLVALPLSEDGKTASHLLVGVVFT